MNDKGCAQRSIAQIVRFLSDFIEDRQRIHSDLKLGIYVESIRPNGLGAYVDLFGQLRKRFKE